MDKNPELGIVNQDVEKQTISSKVCSDFNQITEQFQSSKNGFRE